MGRIVSAIEPHSEADPVAILLQLLVAFGNAIGRTAYFIAEADRHYCNLFIGAVGATSKGRKRSSWPQARGPNGPGDSRESRHAGRVTASRPDEPPWSGALADFALLLAPNDLPEALRLDAATVVIDRAKYLAAPRADIRRGARGPRAAVLGRSWSACGQL